MSSNIKIKLIAWKAAENVRFFKGDFPKWLNELKFFENKAKFIVNFGLYFGQMIEYFWWKF